MLQRHQILLTDWLAEFIKFCSERYDLSFSEVIRLTLCMEIPAWVTIKYPKYKTGISNREVVRQIKKIEAKNRTQEKQHMLISRIYFEARKAIEFVMTEEKKPER